MKAKPCPICGCEHIETWHTEMPWDDYLAVCQNCHFSFSEQGLYGDWPEDAIELWNDEIEEFKKDNTSYLNNDYKVVNVI